MVETQKPGERQISAPHIVLAVLILAIASTVVALYVDTIHAGRLPRFIAAAYGVTTGHPHWRAYQSRVLWSYAVLLAAKLTGRSYGQAYVDATHLLTFAMAFCAAYVFHRMGRPLMRSVAYTMLLLVAFCCLQDKDWLYGWDYLDVIIFLLFSYGIVVEKTASFFVSLYVVAILNHEIALIIPIYLAARSIEIDLGQKAIKLRDKRGLALATSLFVVGIAWMEGIRHILFKSSSLAAIGGDSSHALLGNHLMALQNVSALLSPTQALSDLRPHLVLAALAVLAYGVYRHGSPAIRQAFAMTCVLAIATFISGKVTETRVWLPVVSCMFVLYLAPKRSASRTEMLTTASSDGAMTGAGKT